MLAQTQQVVTRAPIDWQGVAALITALGVLLGGVITAVRAQGRSYEADKTATVAKERADTAKEQAAEALDSKAEHAGVLSELRSLISEQQAQIVAVSTSTAEQLARSTAAVIACEERHADKDGLIAELVGKVDVLTQQVGELTTKVEAR